MTHDISKLPQWAQTHIGKQDSKIARLEADVRRLRDLRNDTGPIDTDTFVDHMEVHADISERYQRLPRGARIVFWDGDTFPDHDCGQLTAYWDRHDHALIVQSSARGWFTIEPGMSNVVRIREVPR